MVALEAVAPAAVELISCIICLPPLIIQIQQRNFPGSVLILSSIIVNFMYAINVMIWSYKHGSSWWDGRIFCDIQIRLFIALEVSIAGAVACIFRQLSLVFHNSTRVRTRGQQRWTRFIEFTLCIALPLVRMSVYYVVQPDRYLLLRVRGCAWTMDASWLGILLMYSWQPIISSIALAYAGLTAFRMLRHRRKTSAILGQQNQDNTMRIMRLYSFAIILLLVAVPIQIYILYYTLPRQLQPFSWSRVHPPNWSERIWDKGRLIQTRLTLIVPYLSIFFGCGIAILVALAPDTMNTYKAWLAGFQNWVRRVRNKSSMAFSFINIHPMQRQGGNHTQTTSHELEAVSDNQRV